MFLLSIPKPCHENWDEMSPREHGSFCKVCAKTVVDFTTLSDEEVKNYFFQHTGQKTCGRFRNDQLAEPRTLQELLSRPIPFWKKFLAIVCIVFGSFLSSCQNTSTDKINESGSITLGEPKPEYENTTTGAILPEIISDTIFEENSCTTVKGDIGIIEVDGVMPIQVIEEPKQKPDTLIFVGEIMEEKKIIPVLPKVDSIKKFIPPGNCDTLPKRFIEP